MGAIGDIVRSSAAILAAAFLLCIRHGSVHSRLADGWRQHCRQRPVSWRMMSLVINLTQH